jgi:hypothetical protein
MANPPVPTERKRRLGNPGKRAIPTIASVTALPPAAGIPEPLRPLGQEGRRMWDRIWSSGQSWIAPSTDIELVQLACEAMDERVSLRVTVLRGGDWRDRVALRSLDGDIRNMLSALGMTPTDRSRLGVAEVRQQSRLELLKAKQTNR